VSGVRVVGELDHNFAWNGERLYEPSDFRVNSRLTCELRGTAASVEGDGSGRWRILRDPLGLNKLFWAESADTVLIAARPRRLVDEGSAFEDIRAVPRGYVLDFSSSESDPVQHSIRPSSWFEPDGRRGAGIETIAAEIRRALHGYLAAIAAKYPAAQVFVCLSGGLDSSGIAALAREHFSNVVAASFDLERRRGQASEDRQTAERLARDLGMPVLGATVREDELFAALDSVLVEGIDWRDFNVHAALVNAALAAAIREAVGGREAGVSVLVLTGDLANEFLVDYQPEIYRGATYYGLPRLEPSALRTSLIQGLDSCQREIGIFEAWGLPVVQPYAAAVDAYLALPEGFLRLEDRKQQLARAVIGSRLPEYVYARPKVRAQVGSSDPAGGVLAACVDRGFDGPWLRRRFAELHGVGDPSALDRFIRGGRYRAATPRLPRAET
jgi:asparagine synthetase B (glutamine-hydrolysing)